MFYLVHRDACNTAVLLKYLLNISLYYLEGVEVPHKHPVGKDDVSDHHDGVLLPAVHCLGVLTACLVTNLAHRHLEDGQDDGRYCAM